MRHNQTFRVFIGILVLGTLIGSTAFAAAPNLQRLFPRGAQQGTQAEVNFYGQRLNDAADIVFHDDGLSLANLEVVSGGHVKATIDIAPECPVGLKGLRVRTESGISNLQLFSVGSLPEISESEGNNSFGQAQAIEMNTTVNGTITREDVDYFSVPLEAGDRIAVEVEAIRLGGPLFDAKVRFFGPEGHERLAVDDTALMRQDAAFVFTTEETGDHRIAVSETTYGGGGSYHYRLHVGNFPRPLSVLPLGGKPETAIDLAWLGDPALDKQPFNVPAARPGNTPIVPATENASAPTAMPFRISQLESTIETEPNNTNDEATTGPAPGAFDGIIGEDGDVDRFAFEGTKGQEFDFRVWARELGSPLDSVLVLIKPSGGAVASNDDSGSPDSSFRATLPEDGRYVLVIRDHLHRGGPTFAYRIEVSSVEPELYATVVDNDPADLTVPQASRTFLLLSPQRNDFGGPLSMSFENLPEGVTADFPAIGGGDSRVPVILAAASTAPISGSLVGLTLKHEAEGSIISGGLRHTIPLTYGRNQTIFADHTVERIATAVSEPAPYTVDLIQPKAPGVKGSRKYVTVVTRRADGFDGEIHVRFPWMPDGLKGSSAKLNGNQDRTQLTVEVRNAKVGDNPLVVEARAAGHRVSTPFVPLEVSEPFLTASMPDVSIDQGQEVELKVALTQNREYEGEYPLTIHALPKGITAEPQNFNHQTGELTYTVKAAEDAPPGKHGNTNLQTTIKMNGEDVPHIFGGGKITVFKPLPPELQEPKEEPKKEEEEKKEDKPERKTRFGPN